MTGADICPAPSSWQDFGLGKVGVPRVGLADVDVAGPVPGPGPVRADGDVVDPVALGALDQVEDVIDLFEEHVLVPQRAEAAFPGAVLARCADAGCGRGGSGWVAKKVSNQNERNGAPSAAQPM
jgi:hypothetical protein